MAKRKKLRDTSHLIFGGAMTLQSTQLLTRPRTTASMVSTAEGFLGIGVAGAAANAAWDMVQRPTHKIKKKKKRR